MSTHEEADENKRRIRTMHEQGYDSIQIAKSVGYSVEHVRKRLREMGYNLQRGEYHVPTKDICDTCKYADCVWNGQSRLCPVETGKPPKGYKKRLERRKHERMD